MNSIKATVFSALVLLVALLSSILIIPPQPVSAAISGSASASGCDFIIGQATDSADPGRELDILVYTRADDGRKEDASRTTANPSFTVAIPLNQKDPFYETVYTVYAQPFTAEQTQLGQTGRTGPCGSGGSGGGDDDGGGGGNNDGGDAPDPGDAVVFEPPIDADFTPAGGELEVETGPVSCNLDASSEPTEGSNPIACRLIQIINVLSVGVGIVITISLVYAGILYTTSRGDPAQTKKAIDRAWQAGIALLLYIFGWALLNFLIPGGVLNG